MTTLHLVLAKHPTKRFAHPVEGRQFLRDVITGLLRIDEKRWHIVGEEIYTGETEHQRSDIRRQPKLLDSLRQKTRVARDIIDRSVQALNRGETPEVVIEPGDLILEANQQQPGRIVMAASSYDEEMQLLTAEASGWKLEGQDYAYRQHQIPEAVENLMRYTRIMARSVKRRGDLLKEQVLGLQRRDPGRDIVVWQGSNHRELTGRRWGMNVEVHRPTEEPFTYYDEMVIRLTNGPEPSERELRAAMEKELKMTRLVLEMLHTLPPVVAIEEMLRVARAQVEAGDASL